VSPSPSDVIAMLREGIGDLRGDLTSLQAEIAEARRDIAAIEARHVALETWRNRFELQVASAQDRFVTKSDELVSELARVHAELAQFRGERSGSHRMTVMLIGLLSAAIGSIATHVLNHL
jgi:chromosome segregation ATPase